MRVLDSFFYYVYIQYQNQKIVGHLICKNISCCNNHDVPDAAQSKHQNSVVQSVECQLNKPLHLFAKCGISL